MSSVFDGIRSFLGRQYQLPAGPLGSVLGQQMLRENEPQTDWTVDLLEIAPDDRVLELGFGGGRGLELAAQKAYIGLVVGIDLSEPMAHAAKRRNKEPIELKRVGVLRGDFAALPFAHEQFDKIFSLHTFYFWTDPLRILDDILHILKPGGVLALTVSTGALDEFGQRTHAPMQANLEDYIIPNMRSSGYASATLHRGPDTGQAGNVAMIARKAM